MVAWKKIMGKFEVGHWMGAQKKASLYLLEKKMPQLSENGGKKKTIGKIK